MFRIYCEWDVDHSDIIFSSKEAGLDWLAANLHVQDLARDDNQTVEEFLDTCLNDNLIGFIRVKLIS
jgi:hypothetical protein